jgi:hypothetical protein
LTSHAKENVTSLFPSNDSVFFMNFYPAKKRKTKLNLAHCSQLSVSHNFKQLKLLDDLVFHSSLTFSPSEFKK